MFKSTRSKTAGAERLLCLLDQNADPNAVRNEYGARYLAAEHGSIDCVKSLLEYHADVHKTTEPRLETALHLATWQHDLELFLKKLSLLQEYGVHLDAQNVDGETVLHFLIRRLRSTKAIEAMLLASASTEKRRCNGHTPLIYALHLGQEDKATVLLNAGADTNVQDEQGRNTLHFAIAPRSISVEFIGQLLNANVDIKHTDQDGHTPLFDAVKLKRDNVIHLLLDRGGDCELGNGGDERYLAQVKLWRRIKLVISSFL
ncbi:unnamed protein product [Penicillium salamii]|nr:unnamed protein product [Penicillium salamii]